MVVNLNGRARSDWSLHGSTVYVCTIMVLLGEGGVVMGGDGFFCFSAHSYKITKAKFNKRIFTMNTTITDTQRDKYIYIYIYIL